MTANEIRKLRESLELTQEQFAKRIGATRGTIARWELGTAKPKGLYLQALEKLKTKAKPK
jgi:DNA-binding transcriptional regulator YiaG